MMLISSEETIGRVCGLWVLPVEVMCPSPSWSYTRNIISLVRGFQKQNRERGIYFKKRKKRERERERERERTKNKTSRGSNLYYLFPSWGKGTMVWRCGAKQTNKKKFINGSSSY